MEVMPDKSRWQFEIYHIVLLLAIAAVTVPDGSYSVSPSGSLSEDDSRQHSNHPKMQGGHVE